MTRQESTERRTPPFRADHVGSFLRPQPLLDARDRFKRGEIGAESLRAIEDDAIRDIVRVQEDLGLRGITDGEFRRTYFHIDFLEQLGGVKTDIPMDANNGWTFTDANMTSINLHGSACDSVMAGTTSSVTIVFNCHIP